MILRDDPEKIARLSHWIKTKDEALKQMPVDAQGGRERVRLSTELVTKIVQEPRPSLAEQADNFVRWLGDNTQAGGDPVRCDLPAIEAIVGSATSREFLFVFDHLKNQGMVAGGRHFDKINKATHIEATLTFPGVQRYDELKRATSDSRKAFMAMEYGHNDLDGMYKDVFKPAVRETGFDLFILPERPKAGLIDDRLRVEIRTSRFLVADLTHENAGAYWEAGYAEGLGKPVIYTCKKQKFEECKTHFDTNHHLTIRWDCAKPQDAATELKATIRATLPEEAKMPVDENN